MAEQMYVYIMTEGSRGTLYIGVTNDLLRRTFEHREGLVKGFTTDYRLTRLVYYEVHDGPLSAIAREKVLKKWNRAWKLELIENANPTWRDLWADIAKL